MKKTAFYANGLNFSCKQCSTCCRYDPGFVFLSEKDLNNLTDALKMEKNKVINTYCRWVSDWKGDLTLSLKEKSNKDCIFWDNGCSVYEVRPLQCITFPFWESILSTEEYWNINAQSCPGMNNGQLHTEEDINSYIELRGSQPIITRAGEKHEN